MKATEIKLQDNLDLKKLFKGKEITIAEFKLIEEELSESKKKVLTE